MTYNETPVDNESARTDIITVNVDEGDDLIDVTSEDDDGAVANRLTIAEALALIASLQEAVMIALDNRDA